MLETQKYNQLCTYLTLRVDGCFAFEYNDIKENMTQNNDILKKIIECMEFNMPQKNSYDIYRFGCHILSLFKHQSCANFYSFFFNVFGRQKFVSKMNVLKYKAHGTIIKALCHTIKHACKQK